MSVPTGRTHSITGRLCHLLCAVVALGLAAFGFVPTAHALDWVQGGYIPANVAVDDDALMVDDRVRVDGVIDGDLIAAGDEVTINGAIKGSVFLVGDTVTINGSIGGSAYILAAHVDLGPQSCVARSAHLVAARVRTQAGSEVGRDVIVGAYQAVVGGRIERDLKGIVLLLDLQGQLRERATYRGNALLPTVVQSPVLATIGYAVLGNDRLTRSVHEMALPERDARETDNEAPEEGTSLLSAWWDGFASNVVVLLLVGAVLLLAIPRQLRTCAERVLIAPLPAPGYGVLVSVLFYVVAAAIAVSVGAIGIALLLTGLSASVLPLYGFAFFGIGFAASAFTLSFTTVSQVVVGFLIGSLVVRRIAPRHAHERVVALVIGAVILSILVPIPTIGAAINALAGFAAVGAVWLVLCDARRRQDTAR